MMENAREQDNGEPWSNSEVADTHSHAERIKHEASKPASESTASSSYAVSEEVSESETDAKDQALCDSEINEIHKDLNDQQLEIDKQLLTLSSALIALSLTFAKEVTSKNPVYVPLLITGLLLLACCILIVLFSFRWSISGLEKAQEYWRARRKATYIEHVFPEGHLAWIKRINILSYVFFAAGFASIACFVTKNVTKEIQMSRDSVSKPPLIIEPARDMTSGSTIKLPPPPPPPPPPTK